MNLYRYCFKTFGIGSVLALIVSCLFITNVNAASNSQSHEKVNDSNSNGKGKNGNLGGHSNSQGKGNTQWWENEEGRRLASMETFFADNQEASDAFRMAPLAIKQGPLNFVGESMIVFRLLAEIFPEIWGTPDEKMSNIGFGPDPFDSGNVLPLGQAYAPSGTFSIPSTEPGEPPLVVTDINYVTFSCIGCHSGGVIGPDHKLIRMVGSASPLGDFFGKINKTVNDDKYTAENFRAKLAEKPFGWVYGKADMLIQEYLERKLFQDPGGAEFFLDEVKFFSNQGAAALAKTLGMHTYSPDNPNLPVDDNGVRQGVSRPTGMPGSLDVFSLAAIGECMPDPDDPSNSVPESCSTTVLPALPGPADIPAVWQMSGRPQFQWDNSIGNLYYREVFASMSVTANDADAINIDNVLLQAPFTAGLPSYPYPFDVEFLAAARGASIFREACEGCHVAGNDVLFPVEEIGTDPNRANVFTDILITNLVEKARDGCTADPECVTNADGSDITDDEVLRSTEAYSTTPLAGIWSTAPYLHNGSVPTLYHLLTGDRPDRFFRGNYTYDKKRVGFTWASGNNGELSLEYDTSLSGYANTGHTGPEYNGGIDWDAEPRKLWDLLEYLKTL